MSLVEELRDAMKLIPDRWRPPITMASMGAVAVVSWYAYLGGPLAEAQNIGVSNGKRITTVEQAIEPIHKDLDTLKSTQSKQGQKLDDLTDSVASLDRKIDILLQRDRASNH